MWNSFKSKILKAVKNKRLNVFGLFFLLTFAFLALTKLSKKYTETISLDIKYVNLPENRLITLDSAPKCNALVSDIGFNLLLYHFKKQYIQIDFEKDVFEKDSNYIWIIDKNDLNLNSQLGASSEIISLEYDTIKFPFETLSVKKVPVVLNSKITFTPGFDILKNYKISPDSINILGSYSNISKISKVETEQLNLKDVNYSINRSLPLKPLDNQSIRYSVNNVTVSAKVEKFTEGTLEIPITIVNKPLDVTVNYFPKTVAVFFYVALNDYKAIKPLDFKVECDFLEVESTNKTFFTPKLVKIPETVKNARMKLNKVEFIIVQ